MTPPAPGAAWFVDMMIFFGIISCGTFGVVRLGPSNVEQRELDVLEGKAYLERNQTFAHRVENSQTL